MGQTLCRSRHIHFCLSDVTHYSMTHVAVCSSQKHLEGIIEIRRRLKTCVTPSDKESAGFGRGTDLSGLMYNYCTDDRDNSHRHAMTWLVRHSSNPSVGCDRALCLNLCFYDGRSVGICSSTFPCALLNRLSEHVSDGT